MQSTDVWGATSSVPLCTLEPTEADEVWKVLLSLSETFVSWMTSSTILAAVDEGVWRRRHLSREGWWPRLNFLHSSCKGTCNCGHLIPRVHRFNLKFEHSDGPWKIWRYLQLSPRWQRPSRNSRHSSWCYNRGNEQFIEYSLRSLSFMNTCLACWKCVAIRIRDATSNIICGSS